MERIMILGAGRTGRGFIGRLAAEAGMPVTFVDKDAELVEKLRKAKDDGGFTVRFYGDEREPIKITDYIAEVPSEKIDFSGISLIMVSVGGAHLTEAGMWLKKVLPTNRLLYVIACENAADPAETLEKTIGLPNVMVSEAAVFCTCNSEGIDILSENYPDLPFDRKRLIGFTAPVPGFKEELSFGNLLQRKIFTYNAASAVIAYMGWLYGFSDYAEAANDPRILKMLDQNYAATNRAICKEFGYDPEEQEAFALLSKKKFTNPAIVDTIARNAREPQRKLGPEERILGPIGLLIRNEEDASVLYKTAAAALLYRDETDPEWTEIQETCSPEEILQKYGKLKDPAIMEHIMGYYEALIHETEDPEGD